MADDDGKSIFTAGKIDGPSNLTSITSKTADAAQQLSESIQAVNREAAPSSEAYKNYRDGARGAAKAQDTLTEVLKREGKALAEEARQIGSWRSQVNSSSTAVSKYLGQLKSVISVSKLYGRHLDELRKGQDTYLQSLNFSSESHKGLQKYVNATNKGMVNATHIMRKYHVSMEHARQTVDIINARFQTQIGALGKHSKVMRSLQDTLVGFSRVTGVDVAVAADYMRSRLDHTNMTIGEVETETKLMAKVGDEFTLSIQKLGPAARSTGLMIRKDLFEVVKNTQGLFKEGMFEATKFGKAAATLSVAMKKMGLTQSEQLAGTTALGKMLSTISSGKELNVAYLRNIQEVEQGSLKVDKAYQKRMDAVRKAMPESGMNTITTLRAMGDALRGNMTLALKSLQDLKRMYPSEEGYKEELMRLSGGDIQGYYVLQALSDTQGALYKSVTSMNKSGKDAKAEAEGFWGKYTKIVGKAATPTDPKYKIALKIYEETEALKNYLQYSQKAILMALIAQAGIEGAGSLLGRGANAANSARTARMLAAEARAAKVAKNASQVTKVAPKSVSKLSSVRKLRVSRKLGSTSKMIASKGMRSGGSRVMARSLAKQGATKGAGSLLGRLGLKAGSGLLKAGSRAIPFVGWALLVLDLAYEGYNLIMHGGENAIKKGRELSDMFAYFGAISDDRNAYLQGMLDEQGHYIKKGEDVAEMGWALLHMGAARTMSKGQRKVLGAMTGMLGSGLMKGYGGKKFTDYYPHRIAERSVHVVKAQAEMWEEAKAYIHKMDGLDRELTDIEEGKLAQAKKAYKKLMYRASRWNKGAMEGADASRQMRRNWLVTTLQNKIMPRILAGEFDVNSAAGLKKIAEELIRDTPALGRYKFSTTALTQILKGEGGDMATTAKLLPMLSILKERGVDVTKLEAYAKSELQRSSLGSGGWRRNLLKRKMGKQGDVANMSERWEDAARVWFRNREELGFDFERVSQDVRKQMAAYAKDMLLEVDIDEDVQPVVQKIKVTPDGVAILHTGGQASFSVHPLMPAIKGGGPTHRSTLGE